MHRVAVIAVEGVVTFDLAIPCQTLGFPFSTLGVSGYDTRVCAATPGLLPTSTGLCVDIPHGLDTVDDAATVIVPGIQDLDNVAPQGVLQAIQAAHQRGARLVSICTGAFVLAAAGVLDGRPATTHWSAAERLAQRYPAVRIDPRPLYIDDGQVLTSAGMAAGIDLCLHLIRHDHDAAIANRVARELVVAPHRSGGQAQYIDQPVPMAPDASLEATRVWMLERLDQPIILAQMAVHARVSVRTFTRRFRAETGVSPVQWLVDQRILRAKRLLETTTDDIESVATRCGFGSALSMRQHFRHATGIPPSTYRHTFHQ
jgi:transcriptional regulator GlxA family with amidase domain